jgi:hypothetical protein
MARFGMNNLRATGPYVQIAFLQAEGEICPKERPQRNNAVARPTRSELQSAGQDSQPISRHPMPAHSIRNAPARTLRRSMRIDHGNTADRILDVTILRPLTWRNNESGPLAWWFSLGHRQKTGQSCEGAATKAYSTSPASLRIYSLSNRVY